MNGNAITIPGKLATKQAKTQKLKKITKAEKKALFIPRKTLMKIGVGILVLAIFAGSAISYVKAYDGKIYPKVVVAGVNVGGMTVDEGKSAVSKKANELNKKGPEITYNGQTLKPKLDEMGVTFNVNEAVNSAYQYGRAGSVWEKLVENFKTLAKQNQIEIKPQIDEEKFNAYLGQLASFAEKEPVNASLSIKNGEIILSPSEKGRGLDKEKLKEELTAFINKGENGKITMVTSDIEPEILEDETADARAQAEIYLAAAPITVTFETNTWQASRAEIGSWIDFNHSGGKLFASANPSSFVSWIAKQVEIAAKDREIEDGTGNVLNEGQDGRGADTKTLLAQIKDALNSRQPNASFALATFAIPRGETTIYPHAQPGRYSGRYIDINLSEQTLYAYEDTTLVNQFLISSGIRSHPSPTGEFHVYGKDRSGLMHGDDYYLPHVPYISWFSGDYSIHGTYWHHNFGHVMSHGCINASIADAEWIFNWDDIGTPVYIHY